jgi:acetylornithine deacetylase/succinyl-diaminopimelate desuccinylase-like protein
MRFQPLPGDVAMPRVQATDFGASERMVVSPGHEAVGSIHKVNEHVAVADLDALPGLYLELIERMLR